MYPIVEYESAGWDSCRGHTNVSDRAQKKCVQFTNHTKDSDWESLVQRRTIARLCALLKLTVRNGLGKLHATGCKGFTIWVGFIMFGKLGTESKVRISESIPFQIRPLKTGENYLQKKSNETPT